MRIDKITFSLHADDRGKLCVIEGNTEIPFPVKRVYYMYDTEEGEVRGKHAHKVLEQIMVCIHGSCKLLLDDGKEREEILLSRPDEGIYISHTLWREMYDFSKDAVLMVLASEMYDESDYIRDYDTFLSYVNTKRK